jgi:hypothetical protein
MAAERIGRAGRSGWPWCACAGAARGLLPPTPGRGWLPACCCWLGLGPTCHMPATCQLVPAVPVGAGALPIVFVHEYNYKIDYL